ncbi:hypothetical protein BH09PAT2_BH09PAT2_05030 [soil metagenome]
MEKLTDSAQNDITQQIQDREDLIESIGVAERNSMTAKLELIGLIGDKEMRLFFPRKRGMEKRVVYMDLAGAAMFPTEQSAIDLLTSLPTGMEEQQESYKDNGVWVNGYVLEKIEGAEVDARVRGFATSNAQSEYEVKAAQLIDFENTMQVEIDQELREEWSVVGNKAQSYFGDEDLPRSWQETPDVLRKELSSADMSVVDRVVPAKRNRLSGRGDNPTVTHTVIAAKQIVISESTIRSLIESQHLQMIDEGTEIITAPIIALEKDYLESIKVSMQDVQGEEDVSLGKQFAHSGHAFIGTGVFD